MQNRINPVVGVVIAIVVLLGVGFLSMKLFGGGGGSGEQVAVKATDPNDPKFKADPKLSGGN